MPLAALTVENLRCIDRAELEFGRGTQLILGPNGAGKTSILEAVFLLGRGRSFRTHLNERLIQHGQPLARSVGEILADPRNHRLGVEILRGADGKGGTVGRLNGNDIRGFADLALAFPVQIIDPDAHKLIEESSARRRRWLDWAVFHVEPSFAAAWSRYQRALKQRNAALRAGRAEFRVWDLELIKDGEIMTAARDRVVSSLSAYWLELAAELTGIEVTLNFQSGWDRYSSLAEALANSEARDLDRRGTQAGPHRADVALRVRGKPAKEVLSRGQQKLAAVALNLCQLEYLKQEFDLRPTVLLDDPSAELDRQRLGAFIKRVERLETQVIVAALDRDTVLFDAPEHVFHVEQGRVFRV